MFVYRGRFLSRVDHTAYDKYVHLSVTTDVVRNSRFKIVLFGNRKAKSKYNITVN